MFVLFKKIICTLLQNVETVYYQVTSLFITIENNVKLHREIISKEIVITEIQGNLFFSFPHVIFLFGFILFHFKLHYNFTFTIFYFNLIHFIYF